MCHQPHMEYRPFDVERTVVAMDQPVLYYLDRSQDGPKRSFVREELQVVPEDMEAPPDFFFQWPKA